MAERPRTRPKPRKAEGEPAAAVVLAAGPPEASPAPTIAPDVVPPVRPGETLARLRRLLDQGDYAPGTRLPAERELAARLGVGRPSLREAIKALSILDVLESRRGAGTYVKNREAGGRGLPEIGSIETANFGMLELLEVRRMLEPKAAWLAAARARESNLREIESARLALETSHADWNEVARLDFELHAAIIRASQNPVLAYVHRMLTPVMMKSRHVSARPASDMSWMHRDHMRIIEAIFARQPDDAEKAMLDHLATTGRDLISEVRR